MNDTLYLLIEKGAALFVRPRTDFTSKTVPH